MSDGQKTFGEALFDNIESNAYLNVLYEAILYNYALKLFHVDKESKPFNQRDALRFADLLSKSNHPERRDSHKMWAQELVILMNELDGDNPLIKLYAGSVFSSTGNHQGLQLINSDFQDFTTLERIFSEFRSEYLTIPAEPDMKFFSAQKEAYDHLTDPCFSYSGPTSMGKSFIMRMFIKDEILHGAKKNYALIVPTKALINEVRSKVISDLGDNLERFNYRVVTAANDIALEEEHNYVLVMTPERLLYLLINGSRPHIDYLFIDEAHKLSGKNSRGPFYYKVVDMLTHQNPMPHFIFASPNIPNPQVYLRLLNDAIECDDDSKLASTYSPVVQVKFLLDFRGPIVEYQVYNDHADHRIPVAMYQCAQNGKDASLLDVLIKIEQDNSELSTEKRKQSIIYYNGKNKAIEAARGFSVALGSSGYKNDPLLEILARDIRQEVHGDYYLADLIRKGIAYHIGYLPASIRARIETLFQSGHITTMFCTSTLLEGVNLPADNLFITDNKIFKSEMSPIDFKNLIGRVGRISFNLYGNVFFVAEAKSITANSFVTLLKQPVPDQSLSVATNPNVLKRVEKKYVVDILKSGSTIIPHRVNSHGEELQTEESYIMMRKFGLILLRDIIEDNDSLVRREFSPPLTKEDEDVIRAQFKDAPYVPDDDINISVDQTKRVAAAIVIQGLKYPEVQNGRFDYYTVLGFLNQLSDVFNWPTYEAKTLGKESLRKRYAVILCEWMSGSGLGFIMQRAIFWRKNHPDDFWINSYTKSVYNDSVEHRNIVFADTLEVIENIILFSISNYFLRFSNMYISTHGEHSLDDNNWYEYVEYGTTNPLTILLQRNGFSREAATYIRNHRNDYVIKDGSTGELKLRDSLLRCGNTSVETEAADIRFNVPGLFVADNTTGGN